MRINYIILITALVCGFLFHTVTVSATKYYVDSDKGSDNNIGTSGKKAWKSLQKVNSMSFNPGDIIFFRRGGVWTGELTINISGEKTLPIIFTAYGKGEKPVIRNPGVNHAVAVRINGSWIIVENFMVREAHEAGINISKGAEYNIIRNNEATRVGIGIAVRGRNNLITHNYAHDLTMVVNNEGGDNDYGAVGIWMFASCNEVCYNRMLNCRAPSLDYGHDGGVVEFYGDVDSCYVHHNHGENCNGSFEVGGRAVTLTHNIISYNVYINNGVAGGFHVGGKFGVSFEDMRIENNVFIDTSHSNYAIGFWNGNPRPTDFLYRNNIFYIPNYQRVSNHPGFIHENNLYFLGGKTDIGIIPGPGEKIGDPLFVNFSKKDFRLSPGSPAIDAGQDLHYTKDFGDNKVPYGSAPDMGAHEYRGGR